VNPDVNPMSAAEQQQVLMYRSRVVMAVVASSPIALIVASTIAYLSRRLVRRRDRRIWVIARGR